MEGLVSINKVGTCAANDSWLNQNSARVKLITPIPIPNMPRRKKNPGKKTTTVRRTSRQAPSTGSQRIATRSTRRLEGEDTEEVTPRPSRKGAQRSTSDPPRAKRPRVGTSHRRESDDDVEESDDTPLTRGDIPSIVDAVLNSFSREGARPRDDDRDNPHVGE